MKNLESVLPGGLSLESMCGGGSIVIEARVGGGGIGEGEKEITFEM